MKELYIVKNTLKKDSEKLFFTSFCGIRSRKQCEK